MKLKRLLALCLILGLVSCTFSALPAASPQQNSQPGTLRSKDEVVYATLTPTGALEGVYVVNILDVSQAGTVTDYGSYSALRNLTDLSEIDQEGGKLTISAPQGKFYYQGNQPEAALPWNLSVAYLLDGKETAPEALVGKSGRLEIRIKTSQNAQVDPVFYENYMLQISLTLDSATCTNLEAPNATLANAGQNQQVTFTVLPGADADLTVSCDTTQAALNGIDVAAVPFQMSFDLPDTTSMTGQLTQLADAIRQLDEGADGLQDGVSQLSSGLRTLQSGSSQYLAGTEEVGRGSQQLLTSSQAIQQALEQLASGVGGGSGEFSLSALTQLPAALTQMAQALGQTSDGLETLRTGYSAAFSALDQAMGAIPDQPLTQQELEQVLRDTQNPTVQKLVEAYGAAQTAKGTYTQVREAFAAVEGALTQTRGAVDQIAQSLEDTAAQLTAALQSSGSADAVAQLSAGLQALSQNYAQFHEGLAAYTQGVAQLSSQYGELHSGVTGLSQGAAQLEDGAEQLASGTGELAGETADLPGRMEEEIDQILDQYDTSDFQPISFTSPQNTQIGSVQFVLRIAGVTPAGEEQPPEEEAPSNFWTRFLDLFRK